MRCDRSQVLIGVFDELDRPTQLALREHVAGCRACTACWIEEQEFRQLMATRADVSPARDLTAPLLAIPGLDLRWIRLRLGLARAARSRLAPLTLAAVVATGGLWFAGWQGFELDDLGAILPLGSAASDQAALPSQARQPAGAPIDRSPVARLEPHLAGDALAQSHEPGADLASDSAMAGSGETAAVGDSPPPVPEVDAELVVVVGPPLEATPTPMPDSSLDGAPGPGAAGSGAPDPDDSGSDSARRPAATDSLSQAATPPAPMPPHTPVPVPSPTPVPLTPEPSPATEWTLTVTVSTDAPGATPVGELLITADALATDGRWQPVYEAAAAFDASGAIRLVVRQSAHPPPYTVTVFGVEQLEGFSLCESTAAWANIGREAFDGSNAAEISFLICPTASSAQAAPPGAETAASPLGAAAPSLPPEPAAPVPPPARPTSAPPVIVPAG